MQDTWFYGTTADKIVSYKGQSCYWHNYMYTALIRGMHTGLQHKGYQISMML